MGLEVYKATIVMIECQFIYSGMILSVRTALLQHMSSKVLVVYRQIIAFLLIAPFAFFSSRKRGTNCCRLNWRSFCLIFLLSFVGVTANQNTNFEGLALVPSSVATAIGNLAPAITFIISYTLGLEKVSIRSVKGIAKIIGTIVCVSGAAAMALFKGPKLLNMELIHPTKSIFLHLGQDNDYTWLVGCLLLFGGVCSLSFWLILQVRLNTYYPDHLSSTAWICLIAAMQSAVIAFIFEPNMQAWKLTSPLQLFSCFYAVRYDVSSYLFAQAWCISMRGPLFTAMFQPLSTLIVTILACIFMHEQLYTGSMIGGLAVIVGLYMVLWGKSKDMELYDEDMKSNPPISYICRVDLEEPFLPETI